MNVISKDKIPKEIIEQHNLLKNIITQAPNEDQKAIKNPKLKLPDNIDNNYFTASLSLYIEGNEIPLKSHQRTFVRKFSFFKKIH